MRIQLTVQDSGYAGQAVSDPAIQFLGCNKLYFSTGK
jgi:hypothetical protein